MHAVQALRQRRSASWTHSAIQTLAVQRGVRGSRQDDKEAEDSWRTDSDADPASDPFDLKKTHDAYNSWKLAARSTQPRATDPTTIQVPPGYQIQLIHSATPEQDSWVSMAFDPTGRLILGMEKKGLLRLSFSNPDHPELASAQVIDTTLEECRGLLHHDGWLYANANRSKALYRLRDAKLEADLVSARGSGEKVGLGRLG